MSLSPAGLFSKTSTSAADGRRSSSAGALAFPTTPETWIESGNRQLDLVDAEDSMELSADPSDRTNFVYGYILVEPDGAGNSQIINYGGDSGAEDIYRKGTLYL